jgi:hypothetical protein
MVLSLKERATMRYKLNNSQKGLIIAIIVFLSFFPPTGAYINLGIDWLFQQMFIYGSYVAAVAGVYIIGYLLWSLRPTPVNIPKKAKKTSPKFIED